MKQSLYQKIQICIKLSLFTVNCTYKKICTCFRILWVSCVRKVKEVCIPNCLYTDCSDYGLNLLENYKTMHYVSLHLFPSLLYGILHIVQPVVVCSRRSKDQTFCHPWHWIVLCIILKIIMVLTQTWEACDVIWVNLKDMTRQTWCLWKVIWTVGFTQSTSETGILNWLFWRALVILPVCKAWLEMTVWAWVTVMVVLRQRHWILVSSGGDWNIWTVAWHVTHGAQPQLLCWDIVDACSGCVAYIRTV